MLYKLCYCNNHSNHFLHTYYMSLIAGVPSIITFWTISVALTICACVSSSSITWYTFFISIADSAFNLFFPSHEEQIPVPEQSGQDIFLSHSHNFIEPYNLPRYFPCLNFADSFNFSYVKRCNSVGSSVFRRVFPGFSLVSVCTYDVLFEFFNLYS